MLGPGTVALIAFGYLFSLFCVAYWAERRKDRGRSFISNPYVYTLSIAVYCTSWTFYGSVGKAATSGMSFLAIYVGPTLIAFSWWMLLRRMVNVARDNHITSIADFVAFRFGKHGKIGALVAVMAIVGITPYIGLQLKAVSTTFDILTMPAGELTGYSESFLGDTAFIVAIVMGVFGGMYGARTLDPSERHEGMIAAVAVESVVKLVALMLVGAFVTWHMYDGFGDIFARISANPEYTHLLTLGKGKGVYTTWLSYLVLSMASVMFLPRQFHVMVVENCEEKHIMPAMWMFPVYLFLINIFVIPIAMGGLLFFGSPEWADSFVLRLPMESGHPVLAMFVFLGGVSASTGMVVISSVTLSTMLMNNLVIPILLRVWKTSNLALILIHLKRAGILFITMVGYFYYHLLGHELMLVNMGLISFGAALQFAPVMVGGLYWRNATPQGAAASLCTGFFIWGYMFLLPSLVEAGWLETSMLIDGPLGISLLRPSAFMGLEGLDIWSHGLIWTLMLNLGAFISVSLLTEPTTEARRQADRFLVTDEDAAFRPGEGYRLAHAPRVKEFERLMARFLGGEKARERMFAYFGGKDYRKLGVISDDTLFGLRQYVEKNLAGAVGPVAASTIMESFLSLKGTTLEGIFDVLGAVSLSLEESREELQSRVRELSVLFEASKKIAATLDESRATEEILGLIKTNLGMDRNGVFMLEGGFLTPMSLDGLPHDIKPVELAPNQNSYLLKAIEGETVFMADAELVSGKHPLELSLISDLKSFIATPIPGESGNIGVLCAGSSERGGYFSSKFIETFEALASELAMAATNARLYSEVMELNHTLEEKVRERTAELEEAMSEIRKLDMMKSQFLANMSHELRTPMNSIIGYTQLIMDGVDGPITDGQKSSLERVESNAQILLKLINEILDLSKIEAGKMELEVGEINIGDLAVEVVEDLVNMAKEKGLSCTCECLPGKHVIHADHVKVREVISNLANNAIKFTDKGGVRLLVGHEEVDGEEGVFIDVEDTGMGIRPEEIENIFVAFKQLDGSTTRAHGGTGLGLNIAKKLVELHKGTLEVRSEPGVGSNFKVWLPRKFMASLGD